MGRKAQKRKRKQVRHGPTTSSRSANDGGKPLGRKHENGGEGREPPTVAPAVEPAPSPVAHASEMTSGQRRPDADAFSADVAASGAAARCSKASGRAGADDKKLVGRSKSRQKARSYPPKGAEANESAPGSSAAASGEAGAGGDKAECGGGGGTAAAFSAVKFSGSRDANAENQCRGHEERETRQQLQQCLFWEPYQLLTAFNSKRGPLSSLLTSDWFAGEDLKFYETIVAAVERMVCHLFHAFRRDCTDTLGAFVESPIFGRNICDVELLKRFGIDCLERLLTLLAVTVQERPEYSEQVLACVRSLLIALDERRATSGERDDAAASAGRRAAALVQRVQLDMAYREGLEEAAVAASQRRSAGGRDEGCGGDRLAAAAGSYRSVSLLPSDGELRYGSTPQLKANQLDGRYRSASDYVETHFHLLREDFVGPLRCSVQELLRRRLAGHQQQERLSDGGRVYRGLTAVRRRDDRGEGVLFEFKLDLTRAAARAAESGKCLQRGSLVVLSCDDFATMTLATVADVTRGASDGRSSSLAVAVLRGFAAVTRALRSPSADLRFAMIESSSYYEGYVHNADILQRLDVDAMPFKQYLIGCGGVGGSLLPQAPQCPAYLRLGTPTSASTRVRKLYDFSSVIASDYLFDERYRRVDVTDDRQWPRAELMCLDESQAEALKSALTRELAVIQGPPGTGKTYVGIKIVDMLLANRHAWVRPALGGGGEHEGQTIVVVCYTNHALDQFLELILDRYPDSVVRVGDRSSSSKLERCNMKELTRVLRHKRLRSYYSVKDRLAQIERKIMRLEEGCSSGIQLKDVSRFLAPQHSSKLRRQSDWSDWLECTDIIARNPEVAEDATLCCSNGGDDDRDDRTWQRSNASSRSKIEGEVNAARLSPLRMSCDEMLSVDDVWSLTVEDRWRMYRCLVNLCSQSQASELEALCEQRRNWRLQLKKLAMYEKLLVFSTRPIVGMTITGAAKYSALMQLLKPRIVIVEEAAEVLEAHVLTSLTDRCEHLILIGDHQQLRPRPEMYKLARDYNLDVSLFERMVKHRRLPFTCLKVQHRMRPEISKIVGTVFYKDLCDHEMVQNREDVRGTAKNVFFVQHSQPESFDNMLRSHCNRFEAIFVTELCMYLMRQSYLATQITVLVGYLGQLIVLKHLLKELHGIRVTTIDNYQGEENDIVILSLIRSSDDGTIGFLKADNRISVAMSRARIGFFCFGNFDFLAARSKTWKAIVESLSESKEIGTALPLCCHLHRNQEYMVSTPEEFALIPQGGCPVTCAAILPCGHTCQDTCHLEDLNHSGSHRCRQKCLKSCNRNHRSCKRPCFQPCEPCYERVLRSFKTCGHEWEVRCHNYSKDVCMHPVVSGRPCGHNVQCTCHFASCLDLYCSKPGWLRAGNQEVKNKCFVLKKQACHELVEMTYKRCDHKIQVSCHVLNCRSYNKCSEPVHVGSNKDPVRCRDFSRTECFSEVFVKLKCGHTLSTRCSDSRSKPVCQAMVTMRCPSCGSEREEPCGASQSMKTICQKTITKVLQCGHALNVECSKQTEPLVCTETVQDILPGCGHSVQRHCCDDVQWRRQCCTTLVDKKLACGHFVQVTCSRQWETPLCKSLVSVKLPCGHKVERHCHDRLSQHKCIEMVKVKQTRCDHYVIAPCHELGKPLICKESVQVEMPLCGHKINKPCGQRVEDVLCTSLVSKSLKCGHKKKTLQCYEDAEDALCLKMVPRSKECEHPAKISCHASNCQFANCSVRVSLAIEGLREITGHCSEVKASLCPITTRRVLSCGHNADVRCRAREDEFVCEVPYNYDLACGHKTTSFCHVARCTTEGCMKSMSDGTACTQLKELSDTCCAVSSMRLPCGHKVEAACHVGKCLEDDCAKLIQWQGQQHECRQLKLDALAIACQEKIQRSLACGHVKHYACADANNCVCPGEAHCGQSEVVGEAIASLPKPICPVHRCDKARKRDLKCGHSVQVKCCEWNMPIRCQALVTELRAVCGHTQERICSAASGAGAGAEDLGPESFRCSSEPCSFVCKHGGCPNPCAQPCEPCTEPCACACEHGRGGPGQCKRLCFQPCEAPACDRQCSRRLACGHECLGMCGEPCPDLCVQCSTQGGQLLEYVCRRYRASPKERFLKLMPCNDVVPVRCMDELVRLYERETTVAANGGCTLVRPLLCPTCSNPIGGCRRYDRLLKRYFNLKRKLPAAAEGDWIGCANGHVRRREETHCAHCQRRRAAGSLPQVGLTVQFVKGRYVEQIGQVHSIWNDEVIVSIHGKLVVAKSSQLLW